MWDGSPGQVDALFRLQTETTYLLLTKASQVGRTFGFGHTNYAVIDHQGVIRYLSSDSIFRANIPAIRTAIEEALAARAAADIAPETDVANIESPPAVDTPNAPIAAPISDVAETEEEAPPTDVRDIDVQPDRFTLETNYPNPFNAATTIRFSLSQAGPISLRIYNAGGHLVRHLLERSLAAGLHHIAWDGRDQSGRDLASGVYLYQVKTIDQTQTRKMLLLR